VRSGAPGVRRLLVVARFRIVPEQSLVAIYARSNVGSIRWETAGLTGSFAAELTESSIDPTVAPEGRLELPLEGLTSGNVVYDAELLRRMEARQYPLASARIHYFDPIGRQNRYQLQGELTIHGVTRMIRGTVAIEADGGSEVQVTGEKVVDIRDFNIPPPKVLRLRIYPDVRVRMRLVGKRDPSS
jgi:polyisoprenoid-binding protein YceI